MDSVYFVYTTWPNTEIAQQAAREIVEEKLAACANVLPSGKSYFYWQHKLEEASEVVVFFKTSQRMEKLLEEKIKALHPYDCPCIVSLDVASGHEPFLSWIRTSLTE